MKQQQPQTIVEGYHPITRWLHAGLVLGVLFQLFGASMMAHPDHHGDKEKVILTETSVDAEHTQNESHHAQALAQQQEAVHQDGGHEHMQQSSASVEEDGHEANAWSAGLMQAHRNGGLLVAMIVLLNLCWAVYPRGHPRKRQITVLFSGQRWLEAWQVFKQLPWMILGKKPLAEPGNSLALIVEMLGLLTMTTMALTGASIWFLWAGLGNMVNDEAMVLMQVHTTFAVLLLMYLAGHITMALLHTKSGDAVFSRISPFRATRKSQDE